MNRPTSKNFFRGEDNSSELSRLLGKKEEEMRILQEKYDRLYICKYVVIQRRTRKATSKWLLGSGCSKRSWKR